MYNRRENVTRYFLLGAILCVPFIAWAGARIYSVVTHQINCNSHLRRAADSSTVEAAKQELDAALKYLDDNGINEGYTSVLWNSPSDDVGFWYRNIRSSRDELGKITSETSQLERTNVLIKLRETLLDRGQNGEYVNAPQGISFFPNNATFFWSGWLAAFVGIFGIHQIFEGLIKKNNLF